MIRGVTKIMRSRRFSCIRAEAEQLAHDRQAAQERDARPGLGDLGDRQAADDRGLAVVDQELVVGLLLLEDEAEVRRGQRLDRRPLGVELHQHLAVVGHVRGDREPDTGLLELHVGAGRARRRSDGRR